MKVEISNDSKVILTMVGGAITTMKMMIMIKLKTNWDIGKQHMIFTEFKQGSATGDDKKRLFSKGFRSQTARIW